MKILDLGKFISKIFKELKINIYPVIAENSANLPFAIYSREGTVHYHKDGEINGASYNISLFAEQYNKSIEMLQSVLDVCRKRHFCEGKSISMEIESTSEDYTDVYVQTIAITMLVS
jgi:hypothetical protein